VRFVSAEREREREGTERPESIWFRCGGHLIKKAMKEIQRISPRGFHVRFGCLDEHASGHVSGRSASLAVE